MVSIRSVQQSASPHACKPNRVESVVTESPFELSFLVPKYNFLLLKTPNLSACLSYLRQLQTSGTVYQQHFSRRHRLFQESSSRRCSYPVFFFFSSSLQRQLFSLVLIDQFQHRTPERPSWQPKYSPSLLHLGFFFSHLNQSCLLNYFRISVKLCDRKSSSRIYIVLELSQPLGSLFLYT